MIKELIENDLAETLKEFVNRNKQHLTNLLLDSFRISLDAMVKEQIKNAIKYYGAQAREEVDLSLNSRISRVVKANFGDQLQEEAEKVVNEKVNSDIIKQRVEQMVNEVVERDLKTFMKNEIKAKVREMVLSKEMRITI